jgi:plasmid stabilization system protein ParE
MKVTISDQAERDLADAIEYLAAQDPSAAERTLDRLYAAFQYLAAGELQGPETRLADGQRVQSWPVPPYRVYYQRSPQETVIVRVHHQSRRPIEA